MKTLRRFIPGVMLGLTIALAGAAFAQQAGPTSGDKKESGCCMSSGCCGDSCSMMKKDAMKNHTTAADKHECCCGGDSCSMMKKDAMKNHATSSDKHECCCCGDSCAMTDGAAKNVAMKEGATGSAKPDCGCCGDGSCDMKHMKEMKNKPK